MKKSLKVVYVLNTSDVKLTSFGRGSTLKTSTSLDDAKQSKKHAQYRQILEAGGYIGC
jgi:hypothetical protein